MFAKNMTTITIRKKKWENWTNRKKITCIGFINWQALFVSFFSLWIQQQTKTQRVKKNFRS
jgi:hypothetical protein